jgi:uncharacterized protein (TIGR00661 family)
MPEHSKHILVAVLDWGLGHATRSIPVIRELLKRGCKVSIAGNGQSLVLLKQEFPQLNFHELESYKVKYSSSLPFMMKVFIQLPKFLRAIRKEHKQVENIIEKQKIDLVISDNRYGCWSPVVPAVLITHQVNILLPTSFRWVGGALNFFNQRLIKRFDLCWIPDSDNARITGTLTAPGVLKIKFIGMLSRFVKRNVPVDEDLILGVISGPEPQREILESLIEQQMKGNAGKFIIVRGIPSGADRKSSHITFLNHVNSNDLGELIQKAAILITRSGYSTIMDLARLEKKAVIMIPTPGQTEQEYLANELDKRKIALLQSQTGFDLTKAMQKVKEYKGFENMDSGPNLLTNAIDELLGMKKISL